MLMGSDFRNLVMNFGHGYAWLSLTFMCCLDQSAPCQFVIIYHVSYLMKRKEPLPFFDHCFGEHFFACFVHAA